MRKILLFVVSALLLLGGASFAFAEVHPASPLSPTDPQPQFLFYCAPYGSPFTTGGYYTPVEGGACIYHLPAITGAFRILEVYRGTVGNATIVQQDFTDPTSNPYTVLETLPNNFGGSQGADFFAVVYGVNTQADLDAADLYFKTNVGSAPPDGFSIVSWKWGVAPVPPTATLSAVPASIVLGQSSTLTWGSNNATSCSGTGFSASGTSGSTSVSPTSNTTYTITCSGDGGSISTSTTVTVTTPPPSDTTAPVITITSPLKYGIYKKTDSVFLTATITDSSPIVASTYWLNGKKINQALPLDLSSAPSVSKASVSAKDSFGNTSTSTVTFFVVKSTSSCLLDIIAILTALSQDKTLPDKPTIQNLIADCAALLKGLHRYDDKGHH